MLSDEVLDKVVERLARRMEQANTYIIEQIGKSIKKVGTLSPTTKHELAQIIQYGGDYDKILRKLKQVTKINIKDLKKIFEEVAKNDYRFAEQFYNYRNKKFIKWEENQPLKDMVNAIEKQTEKAFVNIANVNNMVFGTVGKDGSIIYKPIKKAYSELLDEAILNVSQGKETFDSAMYRQLKEIGSGLKVISTYTDKDGVEHTRATRVDSVLRTQMKDALRQLHNEMQQEVGEQFDADGIEVSVHLNPAPDHEMVQGRQFRKEEFEKFQNDEDAVSYDGIEFPKISEETGHDRRSISEYNCYHYVFSIILGVSKPAYTNKELDKIREDAHKTIEIDGKKYTMYEATQLQRKLEYEIRTAKDEQIMGKTSGNQELIYKSQTKITQLTNKYKELSKRSGLPVKTNRMKISDYSRTSTKEFENKIKIMYNRDTSEENYKIYLKAQKRQEKIRNGEYNLNIIKSKQERHNINSKSYIAGKSYFNISLKEEQELVNKLAGYGYIPATKSGELTNKEICIADKIIGKYINKNMNKTIDTNSFVIHYSKDGVHIVPADYKEEKWKM